MKHDDLVLGVEGGGTKTVAWLAPRQAPSQANVRGRGVAGPSNVRAVGFEVAQQNIELAIQSAFAQASLDRGAVAGICIGLAGADRPAEREPLREWALSKRFADRVVVTSDAMPLLYAGLGNSFGIALISGTGSVAFGRNQAGQVARCGGWGPLFGDEGSGYAIALAGLRAVARAADGRGPATTLRSALLRAVDVPDASGLIPAIYSTRFDRPQIAALAELVFDAAAGGDAVAAAILDDAAGRLVEMTTTVACQLRFDALPIPLCFTGGVLLNQAAHRERVVRGLAERSFQAGPIALVQDAVVGALLIAADDKAELKFQATKDKRQTNPNHQI